MATMENKTPETSSDSPASMEKGNVGRTPSVGVDVPWNLREDDFMTRNGLNLKSFQRRTSPPYVCRQTATDIQQVIGASTNLNSIDQ
jgi:hypothetical protein